MPKRKIIITGGSGLIGRALVEEFNSHAYEVFVLSRRPQAITGMPDAVRIVGWDESNAAGRHSIWEEARAVINLAGENIAGEEFFSLRWTQKRKQAILQSRLAAGEAVTQALQNAIHKPDVFVQASAVGYYGSQRGGVVCDESTPPGDDFLAGVCQAWEASTAILETMGVRRIVVRIGIVLSRDGGALPRQSLPFRFFVGGPIGDGKQSVSWIHIADVAGAIRFLVESGHCRGVYNLTAPQSLSNAEYSLALGKSLHRPSLIPVPAFVLRLFFGEAASMLLEGQRAIPKRLLEDGFHFRYPTIKEALFNLM